MCYPLLDLLLSCQWRTVAVVQLGRTVMLVASTSIHNCVRMPVWLPSVLADCEVGQNRVLPHYCLQFENRFDSLTLYSVMLMICTARFYLHVSYTCPTAHWRASYNVSVQTPSFYLNYILQLFSFDVRITFFSTGLTKFNSRPDRVRFLGERWQWTCVFPVS